MKTSTFMRRVLAAGAAAIGLSLLVATPASAQTTNSRWQAWAGCWSSTTTAMAPPEIAATPVVCLTPLGGLDAIEIATVANGQIMQRDTLDATGSERRIATKECAGVQQARWSADERRVFLNASLNCGPMRSRSSAILSMTDNGEWLDVRGMRSGDGSNVRVARYHAVPVPEDVRNQFASATTSSMGLNGARVAAGARIGTTAVSEASRLVDADVVEAWLLERSQEFPLEARTLIELADAGVPSRITDALVAVSNPRAFQIARAEPRPTLDRDETTGRTIVVMAEPCRASYGYGYDYGSLGYAYGPSSYNSAYGCGSSYGFRGYGSGYGYGYGQYGSGGYYSPPVIVLPGTPSNSEVVTVNPQAVRGRGYTQGRSSSGQSSTSQSPSPSSGSSSSSSGSSSSTTQSQPAQTEQRTAKPRP